MPLPYRLPRLYSLTALLLLVCASAALAVLYQKTAGHGLLIGIVFVALLLLFALLSRAIRGDASDRKQRHDELGRMQLELNMARRNAELASYARTKLAADLIRETRLPLHGIVGVADVVAQTPQNLTQRRRALAIARSGDVLISVLNELLDTGTALNTAHAFDLHAVVQAACDLMAATAAEHGVELAWDIPHEVPRWLRGDSGQLRHAITTLLSFAIPAAEADEVRVVVGTAPSLSIGSVRVTIAHMAPAFGDERLSLRKVIDSLHGEVDELEAGFTARFEVDESASSSTTGAASPRARDAAESVKASRAQTASQSHPREVLLVEDNMLDVLYAEAVLSALECKVTVVADAKASLDTLRSKRFDMIIINCDGPGMDGYTAAPLIRVLEADLGRRATTIVALTSGAWTIDRERGMKAGIDDFIAKPLGVDELRRVVEKWA